MVGGGANGDVKSFHEIAREADVCGTFVRDDETSDYCPRDGHLGVTGGDLLKEGAEISCMLTEAK